MQLARYMAGLVLALAPVMASADSIVRFYCDEDSEGAALTVNGRAQDTCPADAILPAGTYTITARKAVGADQERVFSTRFELADNAIKRVDIVLSQPQLTAEAQKRRDAAAKAAAAAQQEQALKADLEKAQSGDIAGMQAMIERYTSGNGVAKSAAKAREWTGALSAAQRDQAQKLQEQAAGGNPQAMLALANLYRQGTGVPADEQQAAAWEKKGKEILAAQSVREANAQKLKEFTLFPFLKTVPDAAMELAGGPKADPTTSAVFTFSFGLVVSGAVASVMDLVTLPFNITELQALKKAAAGHAAAWSEPNSMMARAHQAESHAQEPVLAGISLH